MKENKILLRLFVTMLKIGLFTFGGGYAMIALLEDELIDKKKWIERDEFLDMAAIAESTPGPIAINVATYIGYKMAGVLGAVVSTVAICIPSFVIIFTISLFFDDFLEYKLIASAFKGIQVCVLYLILSAGFKMFKKMKKSAFNLIVFFCVLVAMLTLSFTAVEFSTVYYILISGFAGFIVYYINGLRLKDKEGRK